MVGDCSRQLWHHRNMQSQALWCISRRPSSISLPPRNRSCRSWVFSVQCGERDKSSSSCLLPRGREHFSQVGDREEGSGSAPSKTWLCPAGVSQHPPPGLGTFWVLPFHPFAFFFHCPSVLCPLLNSGISVVIFLAQLHNRELHTY